MKDIDKLIAILDLPFDHSVFPSFRASGHNVLITGATGVIGMAIFQFLRTSKQYEAGLLDIDCIGTSSNKFYESFFLGERVRYIRMDLTSRNYDDLRESYDFIFHFAGYGQPGKFIPKFEETYFLNVVVLGDLLKRLAVDGRFLNASSSEIYSGGCDSHSELCSSINVDLSSPRKGYILAKLMSEDILTRWGEVNRNARLLSARIALAYGPGAKFSDARVMYQFFRQAALNGEIQMLDQGSSSRSYMFVSDCVNVMIAALFDDTDNAPALINVGGNSTLTILQLAEKIAAFYDAKVIRGPLNHGLVGAPDTVHMNIDISNSYLGKPLLPLDAGLSYVRSWNDQLILSSGNSPLFRGDRK